MKIIDFFVVLIKLEVEIYGKSRKMFEDDFIDVCHTSVHS